MEKLLKREKEVSTLTSQVEALKSQIGGKMSFLFFGGIFVLCVFSLELCIFVKPVGGKYLVHLRL